jgi:hypothetical protein
MPGMIPPLRLPAIGLVTSLLAACGGVAPAAFQDGGVTDAGIEDGGSRDAAGPAPVHRITFAYGPGADSMTLATIKSDGTDLQPVPGFGPLRLDFLAGLAGAGQDVFPLARDAPYAFGSEGARLWPGVMLPRGLGTLRFYADAQARQVGLLAVRPDGATEVLYATAGASTADLANQIAVTRDGSVIAAWQLPDTIALFPADGGTLASGEKLAEHRFPVPVAIGGYSFVGDTLLVVTLDETSQVRRLWRLPAGGDLPPAEIVLPVVDGMTAVWMSTELAASDDGTVAVTTAGVYGRTDVIRIDVGQGTTTNVTQAPRAYRNVGAFSGWNTPSFEEMSQLMISPSGAAVAYVASIPYAGEQNFWGTQLFTNLADGLGTEQRVDIPIISQGERFVSVQNLRFVDDDTLIFTAGPGYFAMDLYRFQRSTRTLENLTGYGVQGPANRLFAVAAMWWSPGRRYLYYIEKTNLYQNVRALDLTTWQIVDVTHDANIYAQMGQNFIPCPQSSEVFFAAMPTGTGLPGPRELFRFDLADPGAATQLTALGGAEFLGLSVSPSCAHVAFAGGSPSMQDLFVVTMEPEVDIRGLLQPTSPSYVGDPMIGTTALVPEDESIIVFAGGPTEQHVRLYAAPLGEPGPAQMIFDGPGERQHLQLLAIAE